MNAPATEIAAAELTGVVKSYLDGTGRQRRVLDGVDATLPAGARIALVGRSGSGKSTLLHCLGGIDHIDAGSIRIAGQELSRMAETELARLRRRHLGYIFQQLNLLPTLNVRENALLRCDLDGHADAAAEARAEQLLQRIGLGERLEDLPERLSGGEQQRLAIVAAMVHRPRLLLADEPTGSLDARTGAAVLDLMLELQEESGCALLVATHDAEIAARCQATWTLAEGRLQR